MCLDRFLTRYIQEAIAQSGFEHIHHTPKVYLSPHPLHPWPCGHVITRQWASTCSLAGIRL